MADKKISALTPVTSLTGVEIIPVVQSSITFSATATQISYVPPQTLNAQTGTTYTMANTDFGKLITLNNAAAIALSVNTGLGTLVGQRIDILQLGAGQITVGGTATVNTSALTKKTRAQYSVCTLLCVATDSYVLIGDLASS
jgi:hypothetical protein